jgi:hypothetical protein
VVTGKVDVRHLAPETLEAEAEDLDEDLAEEPAGEEEGEFEPAALAAAD